jgi:predicted dehydrogenase
MNRVKVGFYGTSNRMKDRILPICAQLQDELEMVCIGGRSEEKARPLGERYGMPWYTDLDAMLDRHAVDMVCNIVNCSANYETAARIAAHGVSCIIETPIELDLKKAHALLDLVRSHGVRIEVAENTFRQPDYRIAKKLLDTGLFGKVLVAYSDLSSHGYHGMSVMRSFAGFDVPAVNVVALHECLSPDGNDRNDGVRAGLIEFANKVVGIHGRIYGHHPFPHRIQKLFVAENGWLARSEGMLVAGRKEKKVRIKRFEHKVGAVKTCQKIVASLPDGSEVVWNNPFVDKPFDDDEISTAAVITSMARAVRDGVAQEYSLRDALWDYEIDTAMCSAHANGRRITMPLDLDAVAAERAKGLY